MQLRDYQVEAIEALYDYFQNHEGNPLLVLPTGAGKSVVIGAFGMDVLKQWPDQRIIVLTHVKELIEQNYEKLITMWPSAPAGIYSASLNSRDLHDSIIFAGIQSVHKRGFDFGKIDLVIIDECHLVPTKSHGTYRKFLKDLKLSNPLLKIIGTTATHYRLDSGLLTEGKDRIFTDVAYDLPIKRLLDAGHLSPLTTPKQDIQIDMTGVRTLGGDFKKSDMDQAVHLPGFTASALKEMCLQGVNRKAWLVFCPSVEYAEEIASELNDRGIKTRCVTGKTPKEERAQILNDFKKGLIQCVTNCDVLTTGFDAPMIDMVVLLRSTKSTSLYVQMVGRGLRISPATGKTNCLVLDFGGNIDRFGPVDSISVRSKRQGEKAELTHAPTKVCDECKEVLSIFVRTCTNCGKEFPFKPENTHNDTASRSAILTEEIVPEWKDVDSVRYAPHFKAGKRPSLKVTYRCGLLFIHEWIFIEAMGPLQARAARWWNGRTLAMIPHTVEAAIDYIDEHPDQFREAGRIQVKKTGKYYEVVDYELNARRLISSKESDRRSVGGA